MELPSELLRAIAAPSGGRVTIIMGSGCSCEEPTNLPLSQELSEQAHSRLVKDGVLKHAECSDPSDLSCLADTVFSKTNSQKALVDRLLDAYAFKTAKPNEGYRIVAAMLCEGAVCAVVTLNFDLAMTSALSELGVTHNVSVIDGPHDLGRLANKNVYYLHRNANASDPDDWVLRTEVIQKSWKGQWQQPVTANALMVPVVVFAGLGSPAAVLIESASLIRAAAPAAVAFQVDPGESENSILFRELGLTPEAFIKLPWCEFMTKLAHRLVQGQSEALMKAVSKKILEENLPEADITNLPNWFESIGLVKLGQFRSHLILRHGKYEPDGEIVRNLVADLLYSVARAEKLSGTTVRLCEDGVIEFMRDGRPVAVYILASGQGSKGLVFVEAAVNKRMRDLQTRNIVPSGAIVGGISEAFTQTPSPPFNILRDDVSSSIVASQPNLIIFHHTNLRSDSNSIRSIVP